MNLISPGGAAGRRPPFRTGSVIGFMFLVSGVACLFIRKYFPGGAWISLGVASVVSDLFYRGSDRWERFSTGRRAAVTAVVLGLIVVSVAFIVLTGIAERRR